LRTDYLQRVLLRHRWPETGRRPLGVSAPTASLRTTAHEWLPGSLWPQGRHRRPSACSAPPTGPRPGLAGEDAHQVRHGRIDRLVGGRRSGPGPHAGWIDLQRIPATISAQTLSPGRL